MLLFIFAVESADAAIITCENDSDCEPLNGIPYSCMNLGTNGSYCEVDFLCTENSDCIGKGNPCCGNTGICDSGYACANDDECIKYQGKDYECINPGTCSSFCYPKGYCDVSTDCIGELYSCCSGRGKCERDYMCSTDEDCPRFTDSSYHCEYAGTCSSYCEIDNEYIEDAKKRCISFEDYPSMDECLFSCMEPKDCSLNYAKRCFECVAYESPVSVGECREDGRFDAEYLCERECRSSGQDCFYDPLSECWECNDVVDDSIKSSCDREREFKNAVECNINCNLEKCYMNHITGCFECLGEREQINLGDSVEKYDFYELVGCKIPYPLSVIHGNDRVLVTDRGEGVKYVLVIENGVITSIEKDNTNNIDIYMSIKNTQIVKDFLKSENSAKYYKDARASNFITIEPADFWSYLKVIFTNILLVFI